MVKKKESVIVFDGEDAFITPRNVIYDKRKGKSTFVGQDGRVSSTPDTKPQEPKADDKPLPATDTIRDTSDTGPTPNDGGPVKPSLGTGLGYSRGNFLMPDPNDPAFCDKIQMFILTNGNGTASAEEIMSAHRAFQNYCKKTPPPSDMGDGSGSGTGDTTPPSGGTRPPKQEIKLPDKAPNKETIVNTTTVVAPLIPENLGLPIAPQGGMLRGGGAGGGGGDEKKQEKKTSYWWLLLVLAAAGGMYYYSKRNK